MRCISSVRCGPLLHTGCFKLRCWLPWCALTVHRSCTICAISASLCAQHAATGNFWVQNCIAGAKFWVRSTFLCAKNCELHQSLRTSMCHCQKVTARVAPLRLMHGLRTPRLLYRVSQVLRVQVTNWLFGFWYLWHDCGWSNRFCLVLRADCTDGMTPLRAGSEKYCLDGGGPFPQPAPMHTFHSIGGACNVISQTVRF